MKRARYPMLPDVEQALKKRRLAAAYEARPDYQRNDYIGWINRAKLAATRQKRIAQMLDELAEGGVYMGMAHNPTRRDLAG